MDSTKITFDPSTGHTCMTCRLVFATSEIQREHYQSEWHRYNVKRQVSMHPHCENLCTSFQVASLPPISLADFEGKVQQFREVSVTKTTSVCNDCAFQTTTAPVQDAGKDRKSVV